MIPLNSILGNIVGNFKEFKKVASSWYSVL